MNTPRLKFFSAFALADGRNWWRNYAKLHQKKVRYVRGFGGLLT
jgi:hypothetical protein